ncbi:MAG: hypothetical protein NC320_03270 [Clostridium sp.]|nr:hypothetical protein [Clostridium sp.]
MKKIKKYFPRKILRSIEDTILILRTESDLKTLQATLKYHPLKSETRVVSGVKYNNPIDVHITIRTKESKNNLLILYVYDHNTQTIKLLDIGTHDYLFGLRGETLIGNELIWL